MAKLYGFGSVLNGDSIDRKYDGNIIILNQKQVKRIFSISAAYSVIEQLVKTNRPDSEAPILGRVFVMKGQPRALFDPKAPYFDPIYSATVSGPATHITEDVNSFQKVFDALITKTGAHHFPFSYPITATEEEDITIVQTACYIKGAVDSTITGGAAADLSDGLRTLSVWGDYGVSPGELFLGKLR